MKNQSNKKQALSTCASISRTMLYVAALLGAVFMTNYGSAQTTNAYDVASDPAYTAYLGVEPDGLSPGGQNGGFGFGAWTFTVSGNGGGSAIQLVPVAGQFLFRAASIEQSR